MQDVVINIFAFQIYNVGYQCYPEHTMSSMAKMVSPVVLELCDWQKHIDDIEFSNLTVEKVKMMLFFPQMKKKAFIVKLPKLYSAFGISGSEKGEPPDANSYVELKDFPSNKDVDSYVWKINVSARGEEQVETMQQLHDFCEALHQRLMKQYPQLKLDTIPWGNIVRIKAPTESSKDKSGVKEFKSPFMAAPIKVEFNSETQRCNAKTFDIHNQPVDPASHIKGTCIEAGVTFQFYMSLKERQKDSGMTMKACQLLFHPQECVDKETSIFGPPEVDESACDENKIEQVVKRPRVETENEEVVKRPRVETENEEGGGSPSVDPSSGVNDGEASEGESSQ